MFRTFKHDPDFQKMFPLELQIFSHCKVNKIFKSFQRKNAIKCDVDNSCLLTNDKML